MALFRDTSLRPAGGVAAAITLLLLSVMMALVAAVPARAQSVEELVRQLPEGNFAERGRVVAQLAATGDTRLASLFEALGAGDLNVVTETGQVVLTAPAGSDVRITDALTGEAAGEVPRNAVERIRVNNSLRRTVRTAIGQLTLLSPNVNTRLVAARSMFQAADPDNIPLLKAALAEEENATVRRVMEEARAVAVLRADASAEETTAAIDVIVSRGDRAALGIFEIEVLGDQPPLNAVARSEFALVLKKHVDLRGASKPRVPEDRAPIFVGKANQLAAVRIALDAVDPILGVLHDAEPGIVATERHHLSA